MHVQDSALAPSRVSSTNVRSRPAPATGGGNARRCGEYWEIPPIMVGHALEKQECECASASHGHSGNAVGLHPATMSIMIVPVRNGSRFLSRPWFPRRYLR